MQNLVPDNLFCPRLPVLPGWAAELFCRIFRRHLQVFVCAQRRRRRVSSPLKLKGRWLGAGGGVVAMRVSALAKGQTEQRPAGVHVGVRGEGRGAGVRIQDDTAGIPSISLHSQEGSPLSSPLQRPEPASGEGSFCDWCPPRSHLRLSS